MGGLRKWWLSVLFKRIHKIKDRDSPTEVDASTNIPPKHDIRHSTAPCPLILALKCLSCCSCPSCLELDWDPPPPTGTGFFSGTESVADLSRFKGRLLVDPIDVLDQVIFPVELSVAVLAGYGRFSRVNELVPLQIFLPRKRLGTEGTLVRPFIVVAEDVALEVLVSGESCPANTAEKSSFTGVDCVAVPFQSRISCKGLGTKPTLVATPLHGLHWRQSLALILSSVFCLVFKALFQANILDVFTGLLHNSSKHFSACPGISYKSPKISKLIISWTRQWLIERRLQKTRHENSILNRMRRSSLDELL